MPIKVKLANQDCTNAKYIGNNTINKSIKLHGVLKLESFDVNLISITKLTKKLNYSFTFFMTIVLSRIAKET